MLGNILKIGSRRSELAIAQTKEVIGCLLSKFPNLLPNIIGINTSGDINNTVPLADIGGKGLFLKEIERALLENKIDIAVHSAKDVPSFIDDRFFISCAIKRSSPYDVLISSKYKKIHDLPDGANIGTCSVRREVQLLAFNKSFNIIPIRGNIGSRIEKLNSFDGIILAEAGLLRTNREHLISHVLHENIMLSAVAQGIVCVQCRKEDTKIIEMLQLINHKESLIEMLAERSFMQAVDGSCHAPMGALAKIDKKNQKLKFHCMLYGSKGIFFEHAELNLHSNINHLCFKLGLLLKERAGKTL